MEQQETVELICLLLDGHSPMEQNQIIAKVLSIAAKARALDLASRNDQRNEADNNLSSFEKILLDSPTFIKQSFAEIQDQVANANTKAIHN